MRSPKDMSVIQIELTNACIHECSNCTRFCGHHKKNFFMDVGFFKKAVDSLDGFSGVLGVMGGEPTLHPRFEECIRYVDKKRPETIPTPYRKPYDDFSVFKKMYMYSKKPKKGLWTCLGPGYYKHFELINDVFIHQVINDHANLSLHQSLLLPRKELGIPDDKWIELRDKCWIQNLWSASITPKGAFFCEIAAALDMLFDGPGGWPVEQGWWERAPEDFGEQLKWCELCSAPLAAPRNYANEGVDIISPGIAEKLQKVHSPKYKKEKYEIFNTSEYAESDYVINQEDGGWFMTDYLQLSRLSSDSSCLYAKHIEVAYLQGLEHSNSLSKKPTLYKSLRLKELKDWVMIVLQHNNKEGQYINKLKHTVLNPGVLYYVVQDNNMVILLFNRRANSLKDIKELPSDPNSLFDFWPQGKIHKLPSNPKQLGKATFVEKNFPVWEKLYWKQKYIPHKLISRILSLLKIRKFLPRK